ncbi:hypothetical protein ACFYMO_30845 [Streptomyces sp. NPDC007025]|uniref:hypothetical protein n=1 Tax=Streptomyces sp. NPDC007025 TaxID=3364771 RepID=UPI0036B420D8
MTTTVSRPAPARTLEEIARAHRPVQLTVLEELVAQFSASRAVTRLLVRGSLAAGTADRLSDVDLVVAVRDTDLTAMADHLDAVLAMTHGALLPGWRDSIVAPDLGGLGYVYLLPQSGHLLQLDLYLCPESAAGQLMQRSGARLLWQASDVRQAARRTRTQAAVEAARRQDAPRTCTELLVQAVVVHHMLTKRLARGERYIAYGLEQDLHATYRDLVRCALVPHSRHHGWYHLPDEIGRTAVGRECLAELDAALNGPGTPTRTRADGSLERVLAAAARICPAAVESLEPALEAYRAWSGPEATR